MNKLVRCKKMKPDSSFVDGCGWQGLTEATTCPGCGSGHLRAVQQLQLPGSASFSLPVDCALNAFPDSTDGERSLVVSKDRAIRDGASYSLQNPQVEVHQPVRSNPAHLSPWDGCIITYVVNNVDASLDLISNPAMPNGWMLISSERMGKSCFFKLQFEVTGEITDRDGIIVRSLIQRLGMR